MYELYLEVAEKHWKLVKTSYKLELNGDDLIQIGLNELSNENWKVVKLIRFSSNKETFTIENTKKRGGCERR